MVAKKKLIGIISAVALLGSMQIVLAAPTMAATGTTTKAANKVLVDKVVNGEHVY